MRTKQRSARQLGLFVAAVVVAVGAQLRVHQHPDSIVGWALLTGAALAVLFAGTDPTSSVEPSGLAREKTPSKVRRWGWGAATALTVAATTVLSAGLYWRVLTLTLWVTGFFLGWLAVRGWVVSPPARPRSPWSRREVVALLAVVLLGATARVLWIGSIPAFFFGDESRVGWSLVLTFRDRIPNFFTMGWNTWPLIGISLQGLFGPFFGITTTTLRLSSALMGTLAIAATYLLARELFAPRVALLAALLFALCRTAIDFSRLGICHAQVMCYETFALFWWWRGVNTGRASSYWWAGIALGLCLYTYNAGELAPVLWVGWLALAVVFARGTLRTHWRAALITAVGMATTMLPYLYYATDHLTFGNNWQQFTGMARHRQTISQVLDAWHAGGANAAVAVLSRQIWLTWLGFGVLPSGGYRELNYRGGGMLDDVTAALFVIGLAMAIRRWRRPREGFVLYWWFVTAVVGGVLTIDPPAIVRLIGLLPALAVLAAFPLEGLLRAGAGTRVRRAGTNAFVAVLLAGAAWINWHTYFVEFARAPFGDLASALGRRIERLPRGSTAFLLGSYDTMTFFNELFHFNYPGRRLEDIADPAQLLPLHRPVTFPLAVILGPSQVTLASYVHALYPHTKVIDDIYARDNRLRFRELRLTPEDIAAQTGLQLTAYDKSDTVIAQRIADPFAGQPAVPTGAARLTWTGRIYWPTDRPVTLAIQVKQPTEVRFADAPVAQIPVPGSNLTLRLARGWQLVSINEPATGEHGLSMLFRDAGTTRSVSAWDLNPNAVQEGLTAVYERNGQPVLHVIDPQLDAFAFTEEPVYVGENAPMVRMPFSATWVGALRITTPGTYKFEAQGTGTYAVRLDDAELVDAVHGSIKSYGDRVSFAERRLAAGLHRIEARWTCNKPAHGLRRVFQLYWTPPDGKRELIPPSSFVPVVAATTATSSLPAARPE